MIFSVLILYGCLLWRFHSRHVWACLYFPVYNILLLQRQLSAIYMLVRPGSLKTKWLIRFWITWKDSNLNYTYYGTSVMGDCVDKFCNQIDSFMMIRSAKSQTSITFRKLLPLRNRAECRVLVGRTCVR